MAFQSSQDLLDGELGVPGKVRSLEAVVENRKEPSRPDLKFQIVMCSAPNSCVCSR